MGAQNDVLGNKLEEFYEWVVLWITLL